MEGGVKKNVVGVSNRDRFGGRKNYFNEGCEIFFVEIPEEQMPSGKTHKGNSGDWRRWANSGGRVPIGVPVL